LRGELLGLGLEAINTLDQKQTENDEFRTFGFKFGVLSRHQ
jgi:hypothetical protein